MKKVDRGLSKYDNSKHLIPKQNLFKNVCTKLQSKLKPQWETAFTGTTKSTINRIENTKC